MFSNFGTTSYNNEPNGHGEEIDYRQYDDDNEDLDEAERDELMLKIYTGQLDKEIEAAENQKTTELNTNNIPITENEANSNESDDGIQLNITNGKQDESDESASGSDSESDLEELKYKGLKKINEQSTKEVNIISEDDDSKSIEQFVADDTSDDAKGGKKSMSASVGHLTMEESNENSAIFHFEELPLELQEHILLRCDDKTLTASIPLLSKLINTLVHDEGSVWRAKCRDYYTESEWEILDELKKLNESWRQFYLRSKIRLLPIVGVDFKTKYSTLKEYPGVENLTLYGMDYKQMRFSFNNNNLTEIGIKKLNSSEKLPEHWEECGLSWNITMRECQNLFERWNATCFVQDCWNAKELIAVKKEYDQFYQFCFRYEPAGADVGPFSIHIRRQFFSRGVFNRTVKPKKNDQ